MSDAMLTREGERGSRMVKPGMREKWLVTGIAFCLSHALVWGAAAHAQGDENSAQRAALKRMRADELADEEARAAAEKRDARGPSVVKEAEREQVSVESEPTLRYEDYQRQVETRMAQKRGEMLSYLDDILDQGVEESEKPDLLFQKSELLLEERQFYFFQGMSLDDQIIAAETEGRTDEANRLKGEKAKSLEDSKNWLREAVVLLEEIADRYPDFDRSPDVLFALGRALWDANSHRKGLDAYRQLIRKYPDNKYAADAWVAFGEYYFQIADDFELDVKKASDAYAKAAEFQDSPVFGYAIYKLGWCHYNRGQYEQALQRFREVVLYSEINSDVLGKRRIALAREARKDYVLAYAQYGSAKVAEEEFGKLAEGVELFSMLQKLADIYYGNGRDRDAAILYKKLIQLRPDSTKNPLLQGKIVKIASRIGNKRQVVGQARQLIEEFKKTRAFCRENASAKEACESDLEEADTLSDNLLRYLSTTWHNEAKKTRQDSTYEYAFELYGDYLSLFPERKEAYEMRFFYAELLYRLERFELAGEQYLAVFAEQPEGKWAEAAAEEAVRAYDEAVKDAKKETRSETAAGFQPREIPELFQKHISACQTYVKNFPKGKIAVEAQYRIARTLYDYNRFDESTPAFMEIVERFPEHARAEQAANLVLDTYNLLENWQALHDAARTFQSNRSLMSNKKFAEQVGRVLEEASFKLVSAFEKEGRWSEAAQRYLAFAEEFRNASLADKALANAAAMYTRAGELARAIKVRKRLVKRYPKSSLVPDQLFLIATAYEQTVSYKQAAQWLEAFVEKSPKDPRAQDALFNASIYQQGTGDTRNAVSIRERYLTLYPKSKDAEDIAYSIAVAWEQAGDMRRAVDAHLDFATKWSRRAPERALFAYYRAVRLMSENRRFRREYPKHLEGLSARARSFRKNPKQETADPLAYLAFLDANETFDAFVGMRIERADNPDKFRISLKSKTVSKDDVYKAYTEVVKLRSPEWAVASLYRIGEANAHLAKTIQAVPPPRAFTSEQAQLFRDKLSEQTLPIEDQAAEAMELCLQKSAELNVFNEWTGRCLEYLEEHRPNQHPRIETEDLPKLEVLGGIENAAHGFVDKLPGAGERIVPVGSTAPDASAAKAETMSGEGGAG